MQISKEQFIRLIEGTCLNINDNLRGQELIEQVKQLKDGEMEILEIVG